QQNPVSETSVSSSAAAYSLDAVWYQARRLMRGLNEKRFAGTRELVRAPQAGARTRPIKLSRDFVIHRANGDTLRGQIVVPWLALTTRNARSWLLVERPVQVNDDDIGMPHNVKEIREGLDWLPIFHLRLWRMCLNLLLRCFNECVRDMINLRQPFWNRDPLQSN